MTSFELQEQLQAIGFKITGNPFADEINECRWHASRRSEIPARECECNDGKPAQIVITPSIFTLQGHHNESAEIELCGEYVHWWRLKAYGISLNNLIEKLPEIEAGLIRAWNALEKS